MCDMVGHGKIFKAINHPTRCMLDKLMCHLSCMLQEVSFSIIVNFIPLALMIVNISAAKHCKTELACYGPEENNSQASAEFVWRYCISDVSHDQCDAYIRCFALR